ncbi:ABC transporter substrate-binding protein [Kitasatospora azatica]|uniref:ABC transporter substrate-binding protein n=1 Tax=Kitasatospora azatica TaxID=58347 RepID=UPI00055D3045|nr:extracellular solute-binding protein [Kitasatospora azatica]
MRLHRTTTALAATLVTATVATACSSSGGGAKNNDSASSQELKGQTVSVAAVWTGTEQENFKKVLDAFTAKTGATTTFISTGDNLSTLVGSKIAGGDPMDVVMVPQPGVLQQFAKQGWLEPLAPAVTEAAGKNFAAVWSNLGTVDGKQYGLYFKAADKSTVWYSPQAFQNAGVQPPTSWAELLKASKAVSDSGLPAFSIGGQAGWPLTDWFENVYLSQAGPELYDKLTKHQIPWTDPSVVKALTTLGQLFGDPTLVAGGTKGALQTDFPTSVSQVFGPQPKAAMTYEGDFVGGVVSGDLKKTVGTDAKVFAFPAVDGGKAPVMGGGDAAVVLKDGRDKAAAQKLVEFLASPEAAAVWAKAGGFLSPNKALDAAVYPDDTTRQFAKSLIDAGDGFRFDMSDQTPAAFGGTAGTGEWKDLQDFLANPADAQGAAARLEADAAKAYQG